jgi:transcriptional regulator with XRE-family HTH domain
MQGRYRATNARVCRQHRGLTQREVASEAGVDQATYSRIERGMEFRDSRLALRLAAALGVSIGVLTGEPLVQIPLAESGEQS